MKLTLSLGMGLLAAAAAQAQTNAAPALTNEQLIERATAAVARQMRDTATVIKWHADNTYETIKKGTSRLVCYDRSDQPGKQAFAVQCTSLGNLDRVAQNRKFEAMTDRTARQAALDEAEKNGTRAKPEFGSVWYDMNGADQEHARVHITIAVPGATSQSTGLPDNPQKGGAWLMNAGTSTAHIMTPGS
jgi:hypothetical protein